jgi:isoquinoline 1-oxidoreductase
MMAEELDVAYESVDMVMGDTDLCPWDAGTWGSLSTRVYGTFVREVASEAKGVLKELASAYLLCPAGRLATRDGMVFDRLNPMHKRRAGHRRLRCYRRQVAASADDARPGQGGFEKRSTDREVETGLKSAVIMSAPNYSLLTIIFGS